VHLAEAASTNDRGRELALAGAPHGTVVTAERQTAGRGRQGRTWTAPAGRALTLSVLARMEASRMELLPLAVALAVCEACEGTAAVECSVKWPNDVWIDGRKVAGILIEARPQEAWAIVGIGLNVDTALEDFPDELRESATSLRIATGAPVAREPVLGALFDRLAKWLDELGKPGRVTAGFRERDALYGRQITWTQDSRRMSGEARGIDDNGALVVFTGESEVHLDAGEVHLERPTDA
jgi:BirA family transcriptional regulator, biotin operon repressor / biotin---[acetyl-CoA-carboxylase] ligase